MRFDIRDLLRRFAAFIYGIQLPSRKRRYKLEKLVSQITDDNLHSETDTGAPVGNEVW
jgi:antitoxin component of MazEF toxin-antitoxin module